MSFQSRVVPLNLARVLLAASAMLAAAPALAETKCANPNAIGVSRVVEIDTTGGPGFGFENYKTYDFLEPKEVVLTFDDGPQKFHTEAVLAALADQCTKAIFFSIGKMALGYPEILRHVVEAGQTVGTHTWSHQNLRKKKVGPDAIDEIERGISAVKRAVGPNLPIAPFFRFPELADSPETLAHLQSRNIAVWSTDIDSFDFKFRNADHTVKAVIDRLEKKGKGIVLMHDIQPTTAKAIPMLLVALKQHGFKVVQVKAKTQLQSLPEFDKAIEADVKGLAPVGSERPTSMVVRTVTDGDKKSNLGAEPMAAGQPASAAQTLPPPSGPGMPVENRAVVASPSSDDAAKAEKKWFWQQK